MGCGATCGRRVDLPLPGQKYQFEVVKGPKKWSVSEKVQSEQKWLEIDSDTGNLRYRAGTLEVTGGPGPDLLMKVDVGDLVFEQVAVAERHSMPEEMSKMWENQWEDSFEEDFQARTILWCMRRSVKAHGDGWNVEGCFGGIASAWSYFQYDGEDGAANDVGTVDAKSKFMSLKATVGDAVYHVLHNLGEYCKGCQSHRARLEVQELGVVAIAEEGWPSRRFTISVDGTLQEPLQALMLGFALARYLHPKDAELRAKARAEQEVEDAD